MEKPGIPPPSGDVPLIMHYNTTFSAAPSPESDGAWDALFPREPRISPPYIPAYFPLSLSGPLVHPALAEDD